MAPPFESIIRITYPEDLPVVARREEIARAISQHQTVIVCGETGSGKTTQLPKICLELEQNIGEQGTGYLIGHTQPRRIAARTVAARIATELNSPLGQRVGYKVRFSDQTHPDTRIKLMTDGILLAETQQDPLLRAYQIIIIDEAHERSLNIDFLLGYLKQLLPRRPDLKLIITSATIDAQRFASHFNDAPVIEVSGRLFPVEIHYRSSDDPTEGEDRDLSRAILGAVDEAMRMGEGDMLVFLPGEREIRETAEALRKHTFASPGGKAGLEILPLFARLSHAEQIRIFTAGRQRRIVLATNVAETSLTVPGIRYVIDTGLARINRYSYRNKVEQLLVEKISQASANQRAGRCGRVMNGVCFRLYSEEDFAVRPEYTDPEILRSSLAAVILRMKSLKIGEVEQFPFIQPPAPRMIADGYQLLAELGALDERKGLTQIGHQLAKFPTDPRIARMIMAARQGNCLSEVLIIASALSLQDPRDRPFEHQQAADQAHQPFRDDRSDFMSYLKLWDFYNELLKHKKSNKKLIEQCRKNFISHRRMREWREIHGQLHILISEMGLRPNQVPAGYDEIHRALLSGLLGNIGFKSDEKGIYEGARTIKFSIFPGSSLRKKQPKWVVAAELAETTKLYARCAAAIDPAWLERIAGKLCKKHYFDPHWEKQRAQAVVFEQVTLYGLIIVAKRRIAYGPVNPAHARELFIREALVAGEYESDALFLRHNQQLIDEIRALESKVRRQDILVDEQQIFEFYAARIPVEIYSGNAFEKWRKQAEQADPQLLYLTREILMRQSADEKTLEQYPETLVAAGHVLSLGYRFDPGHPLDGVTVTVPLPLLNQIMPFHFDWLVPGLIREKIAWYVKMLPKLVRRHTIPVPQFTTRFLEWLDTHPDRTTVLTESLSAFLHKETGIKVPLDTWDNQQLPAHLQMNIKVVDDGGATLGMGYDLATLKAQLGQTAQQLFTRDAGAEPDSIEREGMTCWDFGELPQETSFSRAGKQLTGYPALIDQKQSVAIRLFDTREGAQRSMREGVRRLLCLALKDRIKQLEKNSPADQKTLLLMSHLIEMNRLKEDVYAAIIDLALIGDDPLPRNEEEFNTQVVRARTRLGTVTQEMAGLIHTIAQSCQELKKRLSVLDKSAASLKKDLEEQLHHLIYPGFLSATCWQYLQHLPRYLKGMLLRLDKYNKNPGRDQEQTEMISTLWNQYIQRLNKHHQAEMVDPNLEIFRWQIEELRISLFSQELKTPAPVSVKRLQKLWESVRE
ncbi:ATP-dependent RNA helicase HrpA [Nitrosomonas sp. HPC101]|uniref:ATP-dependent RNA helicase HrpA n=1 Tax=Nitrosomonas sp. HPC101 TaxID=1658667 RepID=UPI001369EB99|nr:ATP-dependent RNA helicase HrpA [Nitrosomonas sp. HPC101]MXS85872.1 ATP-dependent RNA helicase HrpA [Nitrosomonas sp. HPC101]